MPRSVEDHGVAVDPITDIHRRATATVRRRRLYLVVALAVLVILLLVVPEKKSGTTTAGEGGVPAVQVTPPNPSYSSGVTVGGVACGPGVRQVPWSAYAPPCQPAWHGNNGGSTYRGVSSNAITLSFRSAASDQLDLIYSIVPRTVLGTNAEAVATMQAYIALFNKTFELYGRHVVLVPFQGKSDFVDEDLGMDQTQAQEDAVTVATNIKAFADMSTTTASALYASDLAARHVVTWSLYEQPASFYEQYSPWEYTPGPNCTKLAQLTGQVLGRQLGGLPASFAGPGLRNDIRTYGILYPFGPQATTCAQEDAAALERYGQKVVKSLSVKFDLSSLISTADAAIAEFKTAGVTTVILNSTDPITPKFYLEAAAADDYYPEWWFQSYFPAGQTNNDTFSQQFPAGEATHIIGPGNETLAPLEQEALTAFRLGNKILGRSPDAQPVPSYFWNYISLLAFYDGLQLAGPDLTPQTFETGMSHIPPTLPWGMFGSWDGSTGPFDPSSGLHFVRFDEQAVSPLNGQLGAYVACDGDRLIEFSGPPSVPAHWQQSPSTCSQSIGRMTPPASASYAASAGSS